MDILSIIGLILAVGMVLFGIMFDSDTTRVVIGNLHAFWDYPRLAITIGGTIGVDVYKRQRNHGGSHRAGMPYR